MRSTYLLPVYQYFLGEENKYDYLIVGSGVIGCSLGYNIVSNYAKKVCLIEKESLGSGSSLLSAGTIWSVLRNSFKGGGKELWKPIFCRETINIIKNLENNGFKTGWNNCGSLSFVSPVYQDSLLKDFEVQKKAGFAVQLLKGSAEIKKYNPFLHKDINVAIYSPLSGYIEPSYLMEAVSNAGIEYGMKVEENQKVTVIEKIPEWQFWRESNYRVITNKNNIFYTDNVVMCTGSGEKGLYQDLDIELPVQSVRGRIFMSKEPVIDNNINSVVFCMDSIYYWNKHNTLDLTEKIPPFCSHNSNGDLLTNHLYGRTDKDGNFLFGYSRIKSNVYSEDPINAENGLNFFESLFPILRKKYNSEYGWLGFMPFSMTGKPIMDNLSCKGHPNIWICNGFGPFGIMTGLGATKYMAKWMIEGMDKKNDSEIMTQFKYFT